MASTRKRVCKAEARTLLHHVAYNERAARVVTKLCTCACAEQPACCRGVLTCTETCHALCAHDAAAVHAGA